MNADPNPIHSEPRRLSIHLPRPLLIGLATGVLLVVAVGLYVGHAFYSQEVARQEIWRLGGIFAATPLGPGWLRPVFGDNRLARFGHVVQVSLAGKQATDATMPYVGRLSSLEILELTNTQVTDAGLEQMRGLTKLRVLQIGGTQVTDAGVAKLQKALRSVRIIPSAADEKFGMRRLDDQ